VEPLGFSGRPSACRPWHAALMHCRRPVGPTFFVIAPLPGPSFPIFTQNWTDQPANRPHKSACALDLPIYIISRLTPSAAYTTIPTNPTIPYKLSTLLILLLPPPHLKHFSSPHITNTSTLSHTPSSTLDSLLVSLLHLSHPSSQRVSHLTRLSTRTTTSNHFDSVDIICPFPQRPVALVPLFPLDQAPLSGSLCP
jgi:hypothetical protein